MPRTAGECPAQSVSVRVTRSGSISASSRHRHQHRGVRSCTVFDRDCDCDPDTGRCSVVLKTPFLFGEDFQVSSTGLVPCVFPRQAADFAAPEPIARRSPVQGEAGGMRGDLAVEPAVRLCAGFLLPRTGMGENPRLHGGELTSAWAYAAFLTS